MSRGRREASPHARDMTRTSIPGAVVLAGAVALASCSGGAEVADSTGEAPLAGAPLKSTELARPVEGHCARAVRFADPGLDSAVRQALGVPSGPIPPDAAAALTLLAAAF